ncbi:MAG: NTP transferase domain-containing protein [Planctomycetota bacterium]|jgi:NDP-sugar pyrophosphorylase family protein|nr:NTP transferase domain-containing protein [Planctomycetota bacterium]
MLPIAILAGGLATRLGGLTKATPKALLPVAGEPFIRRQLRLLSRNGFAEAVVCAGFLGDQIEKTVGDGREFGLAVSYSFDWPDLLGTGGALKNALPLLGDRFMILYGDSYLTIDYQKVAAAFAASGKPALLTVFRNDGRFDASNVIFAGGAIRLYDKKVKTPEMNYIDYGLGCLSAGILSSWPVDKFDLAEVYAALSKTGSLAGHEVFERFYEIGSVGGLEELDGLLRNRET